MAVPRKRNTSGARNQRRAKKGLTMPAIGICSMCKSPKAPHNVCMVCGTYKKRQVIKKKSAKTEAKVVKPAKKEKVAKEKKTTTKVTTKKATKTTKKES